MKTRLAIDAEEHVHVAWVSGDSSHLVLHHAVDDRQPEVVYEGADLSLFYALELDREGHPVVAFATGGVYGVNRADSYSLQIGTRASDGTWHLEALSARERSGAGILVSSDAARWFVWTHWYGGARVVPGGFAVNLDTAREFALPGVPESTAIKGAWVDQAGGLQVLATRPHSTWGGSDLVHFRSEGGRAGGWTPTIIQASRQIPDRGDVGGGLSQVGVAVQVTVDALGIAHAFYLEFGVRDTPIEWVYARFDDAWTTHARETLQVSDGIPLWVTSDLTAGRDGVLRLLLPAQSMGPILDRKPALLVVDIGRCAATCSF